MTVNNWQTEAAKLSQAIHDPNSDSQKPIIVLGSPKDLRNVLTKPTTTPPNIMQTLSPRVRRLAMQMQARNGGGMPGMPGMPPGMPGMPGMPPGMPGMPGMPPGMPSGGGNRTDALKGLLGALMASRGGMPSGGAAMPAMPTQPAMPGMMGVAKSLKKGKTMNHSRGRMCAECGAIEKSCNCNNKRGSKMNKRGSINKGMLDSIKAFLSHVINNTPYGDNGSATGARAMATGQGGSLGRGGQNLAAQRRRRSNNENADLSWAERRDQTARNKDRYEEIKTKGQDRDLRPSYSRRVQDPDNPYTTERGSNQTQVNRRNQSVANRSGKEYREMLMSNPDGKNYGAESSARNLEANRNRAKEMREANEMRRANPNGANNLNRQNREERDYRNAQDSGMGGKRVYTRSGSSTNKSMSKSITSMDRNGTRHVIGGYSISKRARPANNTNVTRNKFGY